MVDANYVIRSIAAELLIVGRAVVAATPRLVRNIADLPVSFRLVRQIWVIVKQWYPELPVRIHLAVAAYFMIEEWVIVKLLQFIAWKRWLKHAFGTRLNGHLLA